MYKLFDVLFTVLHLTIIGFNLFGWIWKSTRKLHLIVVAVTLTSWLLLGVWYGIGYCPLTEWHWQVKEHLGKQNLPDSFIKYIADKLCSRSINEELIDLLTASGFASAILLSLYVNLYKKK